ncbi:hypothetical protein [Ruegeria sp. HKCCD6109]|uniref:hypothetical protein n=1 Tax=Ruegeria sp. HKCCD6109 TaxID=2683017 RepID=UPI0014915F19|nr:hypothetical protein [Ruegeria sp. HKCCD6109]NOD65735.1 hypothetical protein [Ruegeria sp. HKCCD6109]
MKIKNTNSTTTIRGVSFPKGKAVTVTDPDLAKKALARPGFTEVKRNDKNKK